MLRIGRMRNCINNPCKVIWILIQTDKYKTEFVTIKSVDGTNLRLSDFIQTDGYDRVYLLRVPFRLNKMPEDGYVGKPITLNLTEQTFVMGCNLKTV